MSSEQNLVIGMREIVAHCRGALLEAREHLTEAREKLGNDEARDLMVYVDYELALVLSGLLTAMGMADDGLDRFWA